MTVFPLYYIQVNQVPIELMNPFTRAPTFSGPKHLQLVWNVFFVSTVKGLLTLMRPGQLYFDHSTERKIDDVCAF